MTSRAVLHLTCDRCGKNHEIGDLPMEGGQIVPTSQPPRPLNWTDLHRRTNDRTGWVGREWVYLLCDDCTEGFGIWIRPRPGGLLQ